MDQWEYYTIVIASNGQGGWISEGSDGQRLTGNSIADVLNQLGFSGWEVISFTPGHYSRTNWMDSFAQYAKYPSASWATEWTADQYRILFKRKRS